MSVSLSSRIVGGSLVLALVAGACSTESGLPVEQLEFETRGAALTQRHRAEGAFSATLLGRYATGIVDSESSGETAAINGDRLFVTSAVATVLDVVDIADPSQPVLVRRVDLTPYGASVQSVDVSSRGLVAVAVGALVKTDPGTIVLLDDEGNVLRTATVGSLPDMVAFTPNGKQLVVANEGEPGCYGEGCVDPLGSVSILAVHPLDSKVAVTTLDFANVAIPTGVRVFGPGATAAQDLEPEFATISEDSKLAYVSLQENNAIALVDLNKLKILGVRALGFKDFSDPAIGGLDASDRDNLINIQNWPVYGMYQPDALANYQVRGKRYLVSANEGDARDYDGFAEEARARSLSANYPTLPPVANDAELGRLTVTVAPPNGDYSQPYVFGTRSFSIWDAKTGAQVWDSGAELERRVAEAFPLYFNSSNDATAFDNRSDNKGPEPEGVAVGKLNRRTYAFVALERMGGIAVYDVSNPTAPAFQTYLTTRDYTAAEVGPDSGPEVVKFIEADKSPTGEPLLMVAHEITGTVTLWDLADGGNGCD